jgi:hypothetical protein
MRKESAQSNAPSNQNFFEYQQLDNFIKRKQGEYLEEKRLGNFNPTLYVKIFQQ